MVKKKQKELTFVGLVLGTCIFAINFKFFSGTGIFPLINIIAALATLLPPLGTMYLDRKKTQEIEKHFPNFLRDITANIKTGMTLTQAIQSTKRNDYHILNPYVDDMIAKIDWGISFERVLQNFSDAVNSPIIRRTVKTITETHKSGGKIGDVLESVANSVQEVEKIKKERSSRIYSQMMNGYIIFFVFLGVMWLLSSFLVPAFQSSEMGAGTENIAATFDVLFLRLIVIQGLFAGLSIGQMAEGSIVAGFKHSFALGTIGYTVFSFL